MFTKEFVCHLNLAGADARPDDDVGELDQVQDVPLVTAQAHCLSLNLQFYSIVSILDCFARLRCTRKLEGGRPEASGCQIFGLIALRYCWDGQTFKNIYF